MFQETENVSGLAAFDCCIQVSGSGECMEIRITIRFGSNPIVCFNGILKSRIRHIAPTVGNMRKCAGTKFRNGDSEFCITTTIFTTNKLSRSISRYSKPEISIQFIGINTANHVNSSNFTSADILICGELLADGLGLSPRFHNLHLFQKSIVFNPMWIDIPILSITHPIQMSSNFGKINTICAFLLNILGGAGFHNS